MILIGWEKKHCSEAKIDKMANVKYCRLLYLGQFYYTYIFTNLEWHDCLDRGKFQAILLRHK